MAAFLPKYFEAQFQLSPGDAAMFVGAIVVPAGAGGTLIGGYVAKRLKLGRAGSIKMYMVCQAIILPLYLGFLLYCPNGDFAGLNVPLSSSHEILNIVPYNSSWGPLALSYAQSEDSSQFSNSCNSNCGCLSDNFDPVCSLHEDITYYSPCHAGKNSNSERNFIFTIFLYLRVSTG